MRFLIASLLCLSIVCPQFAFADDPPAATTGRHEGDAPDHPVGSPPPPSETGVGFSFGSYGRAGIGIDGRGHEGYAVNVVSHGSRLEAEPYLELDIYYGGKVGQSDARWRVVLAPAFDGDLFHYNGNFSSNFAVRNAYAETAGVGYSGLSLWAGSRMLRGDDIYLFNYWPLDNLNTVGGGAFLEIGHFTLQIHGGLNLLNNPFQQETISEPARGLGPPSTSLVLDRPRSIGSFKATYRFGHGDSPRGAKISLYGEYHYLPAGNYVYVTQNNRAVPLPADSGFVVGGQLGGWLRPYVFANLFFRYAGGLAVYGDLALPYTVDPNRTSGQAREWVLALSANWESKWLGIMAGAFLRRFQDPQNSNYDEQNYIEGHIAVRPQVYLGKYFAVAAEGSFQQRQYGGFDPLYNKQLTPHVWRFSLLPMVSPNGRGTYSRPIVYANFTVSSLNDDARLALFNPSDVRATEMTPSGPQPITTVYYLGIGAEWWFQSSYR